MTEHKVLNGPVFPFDVRTDYVKVTEDTVLVPITLQIKNNDITFSTKDGVSKGVVNILGRVTTITGRVAQTFEDTVLVEQPSELMPKTLETSQVYWKALPLRPGHYRVDIAIKDVNNPDHLGTLGPGHRCAQVRRRKPSHFLADSRRQNGAGAVQADRDGQLHPGQYICAASGDGQCSDPGQFSSQPAVELLDAGL